MKHIALVLLLACGATARAADLRPDPPHVCDACAEWNGPREPFRVFGDTWFVGPAGLGSVLITSDKGHILLDGGLPQSAAEIDAHIRKLGFRTEDVKLIVNSHAHYDHAGGIAALQRASGATVAASAKGAEAIELGRATDDDPQAGFGAGPNGYPAVAHVRVVKDGETLRVGPLALTAHLTPGHTPGSTTWTWRSCEGKRCLDLVYADSLNPVSAPGFRFTDGKGGGLEPSFRKSIATVAALPCDILLAVHPAFAQMDEKLKGRTKDHDPLIDPTACRTYAAQAAERLDARVKEEAAAAAAKP